MPGRFDRSSIAGAGMFSPRLSDEENMVAFTLYILDDLQDFGSANTETTSIARSG